MPDSRSNGDAFIVARYRNLDPGDAVGGGSKPTRNCLMFCKKRLLSNLLYCPWAKKSPGASRFRPTCAIAAVFINVGQLRGQVLEKREGGLGRKEGRKEGREEEGKVKRHAITKDRYGV